MQHAQKLLRLKDKIKNEKNLLKKNEALKIQEIKDPIKELGNKDEFKEKLNFEPNKRFVVVIHLQILNLHVHLHRLHHK